MIQDRPRALLTTMLVTSAGAVELWLAVRFVQAPEVLPMLLAVHAGVATMALLLALLSPGSGGRHPLLMLFVVMLAFLGPLGVAGTALAAVLRAAFAWRARPFLEWYAALFPTTAPERTEALHERVVLRGHGPAARTTVAPFGDVIARGTLAEKQAALSLSAAGFRAEFAPALRTALNDPEAAIRVQAASAVAQIERNFVERSEALEARLAERADDATLIDLARHKEAMAASGLLDEGRAREAATAALALHLRLAAPGPGMRADSAGAAGRLLLRLGRAEEAARLLAEADRRAPATPEILSPYLESLFQLHRFIELREICRRLSLDGGQTLGEALGDVVRLWADDGEDPMLAVHGA